MALYMCPIPRMEKQEDDEDWVQPGYDQIQFTSDGYAVITLHGLSLLKECSTQPAKAYSGKMWKTVGQDIEFLCWFQESSLPGAFNVKHRKILLKETFDLINPEGEGNE